MGDDILIEPSASQIRQIRVASHIFVHPKYSINTLENDIAVIRLSTAFIRSNSFHPIPRAAITPTPNERCRVAGWGATVEVYFLISAFYLWKIK